MPFVAMPDGPHAQVDAFHAAEGLLDVPETLVGADDVGGAHRVRAFAGAEDVDAVERGLACDGGVVALEAQPRVLDGHIEVFADVVVVDDFPDLHADLVGGHRRLGAPCHSRGDPCEARFGGGQEFVNASVHGPRPRPGCNTPRAVRRDRRRW